MIPNNSERAAASERTRPAVGVSAVVAESIFIQSVHMYARNVQGGGRVGAGGRGLGAATYSDWLLQVTCAASHVCRQSQ